jgi:chaperone required for assembly of F1-ATPase
MAKEFKGFGKVPPKRQSKNAIDRSFDNLRQNVAKNYGEDITLLMNPDKATKMSEVLENFVSPYMDVTESKEGLQILFSMGMSAWNIALEPVEQRAETIEQFVNKVFRTQSAKSTEVGKNFIVELIDRKNKLFVNNQRRIISFDLDYISVGEYHISVASTMPS